ncbi:hypothetical protein V8F20_009364 [Naviculisporaceae sp. PSN 640]
MKISDLTTDTAPIASGRDSRPGEAVNDEFKSTFYSPKKIQDWANQTPSEPFIADIIPLPSDVRRALTNSTIPDTGTPTIPKTSLCSPHASNNRTMHRALSPSSMRCEDGHSESGMDSQSKRSDSSRSGLRPVRKSDFLPAPRKTIMIDEMTHRLQNPKTLPPKPLLKAPQVNPPPTLISMDDVKKMCHPPSPEVRAPKNRLKMPSALIKEFEGEKRPDKHTYERIRAVHRQVIEGRIDYLTKSVSRMDEYLDCYFEQHPVGPVTDHPGGSSLDHPGGSCLEHHEGSCMDHHGGSFVDHPVDRPTARRERKRDIDVHPTTAPKPRPVHENWKAGHKIERTVSPLSLDKKEKDERKIRQLPPIEFDTKPSKKTNSTANTRPDQRPDCSEDFMPRRGEGKKNNLRIDVQKAQQGYLNGDAQAVRVAVKPLFVAEQNCDFDGKSSMGVKNPMRPKVSNAKRSRAEGGKRASDKDHFDFEALNEAFKKVKKDVEEKKQTRRTVIKTQVDGRSEMPPKFEEPLSVAERNRNLDENARIRVKKPTRASLSREDMKREKPSSITPPSVAEQNRHFEENCAVWVTEMEDQKINKSTSVRQPERAKVGIETPDNLDRITAKVLPQVGSMFKFSVSAGKPVEKPSPVTACKLRNEEALVDAFEKLQLRNKKSQGHAQQAEKPEPLIYTYTNPVHVPEQPKVEKAGDGAGVDAVRGDTIAKKEEDGVVQTVGDGLSNTEKAGVDATAVASLEKSDEDEVIDADEEFSDYDMVESNVPGGSSFLAEDDWLVVSTEDGY